MSGLVSVSFVPRTGQSKRIIACFDPSSDGIRVCTNLEASFNLEASLNHETVRTKMFPEKVRRSYSLVLRFVEPPSSPSKRVASHDRSSAADHTHSRACSGIVGILASSADQPSYHVSVGLAVARLLARLSR